MKPGNPPENDPGTVPNPATLGALKDKEWEL